MSDKQKGMSLRKKRGVKSKKTAPTISAPRQISAPMPTALPQASRPSQDSARDRSRGPDDRQQRARADRTADLVKRRYSQKVMQLPSDFPGAGAPMPALPPLPSQYRDRDPSQTRDRDDRPADARSLRVDMRVLRDPNLQADQYVAAMLADASEDDIRRYQEELRKAKHRTSVDLQSNVYQNRTQFIKISKEAEKLKGEMRTLRQLMADLTTTLEQTASATANDAVSARRANRSSIGDLNQIRAGQLQQLYRDVEGSQKYLPPIPGRFIVWKSRRWFELDSATLKARRRVRLLLLNDHLLLAAEKKARNDIAGQRDRNRSAVEYVAQRCFALQDVQVSRAPEERVIIRVGNESITLDTKQEDTGDKITFLSTFRKTKDDLRKSQEAEVEEKDRTQDSYNHMLSRDPGLRSQTELLETMSEGVSNNNASTFVDIDGQTRNIRWVEAQLDDLDIEIALQHFSAAVAKVEKLKALSQNMRGNEMAKTIVTFKVNERAARLAAVLVRQLADGNAWNGPVTQHVTWVIRLGFEDRAREAYLDARSAMIRTRARQCTFEGNLPDYIFQLSSIYFLALRNTVATFQSCFPPPLMSACVKWAKEHVDRFNVVLERQLSSVEREGETWRECLGLAQEHAGLLREVGLDFSELVGRGGEEGLLIGGERGERAPVGLGVS
ncbi:Cullin repeat-like-containing domain protein [Boeremia exigua]|uniref:Cullin repeat-like-containing domain protein n=1 Tax=Boeremia exigua TaxID=749465 RepID=UPI001E8E0170|nr:Cullin repeat-like-containing domain protein [Boeremia exigua]KAH6614131.1 Cullin repeat-like-containing domain protein [Boeremia exigua]